MGSVWLDDSVLLGHWRSPRQGHRSRVAQVEVVGADDGTLMPNAPRL